MLDERSLRRPGFQPESAPVVLADGQTWWLAKPIVCLRPSFSGGRAKSVSTKTTWGEDFDRLVESVDAGPSDEMFNNILNIGAFMLCQNYELADEDLESLFVVTIADDNPSDLLADIMKVARGQAPKHSPGGNA